ncbi:MAG: type II methionyl aminopeptidase [Nanoarchaeota archaeon]
MEQFSREILLDIGKFTQELREKVIEIVKKDVSLSFIVDFVEESILKEGYKPAFPCTVCINEIAAHYTYYDEDYILKKGDLVKVDFGINYQGNITDNAFTIQIDTNKYDDLIKANQIALNNLLDYIKPKKTLDELGKIVFDTAKDSNLNTIHNLSGHEIGKDNLHYGLHIPNYSNGSLKEIPSNALIALEPFLTYGAPLVKSIGNSNILHLVSDKSVRDPIAKKVLECIKENYPKLPFSKRWLLKHFDKKKVDYAIKILKLYKIVHEYDILSSKDSSFISQFEETVLFIDDKKYIITRQKK